MTGTEIRPDSLYTPLLPFSGDLNGRVGVWNPGASRLRGDHPAVVKWPGHFVPEDMDSETLRRMRAVKLFPVADAPPTPKPPAIPPEHEAIAAETFHADEDFVRKGQVRDDR